MVDGILDLKDKDIRSLEHTSWRCQYHIVFAPEYRRPANNTSMAE